MANPDMNLDPAYVEAGRLLLDEDPKELARKVLKDLLPRFTPQEAKDHLLKWGHRLGDVRQLDVEHEIISAALYVLAEPNPTQKAEDRTLRAALERARDDLAMAEAWLREGQGTPIKVRTVHEAQARITKALDPDGQG